MKAKMTVKELINKCKNNENWTTGKVFICHPVEVMMRRRERGETTNLDGELFLPEELDQDTLNKEITFNKWWIEDGDLCIDFHRTW